MRLVIVLFAIAAATTVARGDVHVSKVANLSIEVPHDWKIDVKKNVMFALDPSNAVVVMFASEPDVTDPSKLVDIINKLLSFTTELKWGPQTKVELNGLGAVTMSGTAMANRTAQTLRAVMVVTPNKVGTYLITGVYTSFESAHKAELDAIVASLKPVK
jgi:predicted Zn-dependent protease